MPKNVHTRVLGRSQHKPAHFESLAESGISDAPRQEAAARDVLMTLLPSSSGSPRSRQKLQTLASRSDIGYLLRGIRHN